MLGSMLLEEGDVVDADGDLRRKTYVGGWAYSSERFLVRMYAT